MPAPDINDPRTWAQHGPYRLNPQTSLWEKPSIAGLPPAGQSTTTPFWYPSQPVDPGDPSAFRHIVEGRNELVRQLYGQMPQTQNPYGDSPGRGRMGQTLMALLGMAGRSSQPGYAPNSQALFGQDVQRLGAPAQRGLALQEPERLSKLMQLLTGAYGLGGKTSAEAESEFAKLEQMIALNRRQKRAQYSQIPIVGPLLAGLS